MPTTFYLIATHFHGSPNYLVALFHGTNKGDSSDFSSLESACLFHFDHKISFDHQISFCGHHRGGIRGCQCARTFAKHQ